jgi:hypothetical protein
VTHYALSEPARLLMLLRQAGDADGHFGIDFGAYYLAAERVVQGEALYRRRSSTAPSRRRVSICISTCRPRASRSVWLPLALFSAIVLAGTSLVVIWPPSTDGSPARLRTEATA